MSRWIVYKHRFLYTGKCKSPTAASPCTLEFIVSVNGKTMSEKQVKRTAVKIFNKIAEECKFDNRMNMPCYDFGSLSWNDILDDVRKLFIVDYPKRTGTKVQLWLEKSDAAIWDDGNEEF